MRIIRQRAAAATDAASAAQFPCAMSSDAASGLADLYNSDWWKSFIAYLDSGEESSNYAQAAGDVAGVLARRGPDRGLVYPLEVLRALAVLYRRVMAATPHARSLV